MSDKKLKNMTKREVERWIREKIADKAIEVVEDTQDELKRAVDHAENRLKAVVGEMQEASKISIRTTDAIDILVRGGKIITKEFKAERDDDTSSYRVEISGMNFISNNQYSTCGSNYQDYLKLEQGKKYRVTLIIEPLE